MDALTRLREPHHRVSRRAVPFWAARAAAGWLVVLAVELIVVANATHPPSWLYTVLVASVVIAVAHVVVMPAWRYRVHRWEITDQAVYTQSGWFNQERRIAPISRIQTVDVRRGPLEQLFRLANVTVTTASAEGPLEIHGLEHRTAEQIVEMLTADNGPAADDAT